MAKKDKNKKGKKNKQSGKDALAGLIETPKSKPIETIDVEKALTIEEDQLEAEWIELPMLLFTYGDMLSAADQRVRGLEEDIKTTRSSLILSINDNPEDYDLAKVTAQTVEACYRTQKEYVRLKKELNEAVYHSSSIRNVVFSINAKKTALESLTKIQMQEYYASRSSDGGSEEERVKPEMNKRNKNKNK